MMSISPTFERKKRRFGTLLGLFAGAFFAIGAMGFDAIALAGDHYVMPFLRFLPGLLVCSTVGALAGKLTVRHNSHLLGVLYWLLAALLMLAFTYWFTFSGAPKLIGWLQPQYAPYIQARLPGQFGHFWIIGLLAVGGIGVLIGLLEINVVEQALGAYAEVTSMVILLVCAALLIIGGLAVDNITSAKFREPVGGLDELIHFAVDHVDEEVDILVSRKMYLHVMENLGKEVYIKPHKLLLTDFDPNWMSSFTLLTDFGGDLVQCRVVGSQPVDCKPVPSLH